jgi:hypothetical protein
VTSTAPDWRTSRPLPRPRRQATLDSLRWSCFTRTSFADFAPHADPPSGVIEGVDLPEDWDDQPRFAIALNMLEKRGITAPTWFDGRELPARA